MTLFRTPTAREELAALAEAEACHHDGGLTYAPAGRNGVAAAHWVGCGPNPGTHHRDTIAYLRRKDCLEQHFLEIGRAHLRLTTAGRVALARLRETLTEPEA